MANPQPTDAHLRMAHSIYEAIMQRDFTKRQRKIMDLILRLSWGCGKKEAYIPHQKDFSVVGVYEVDVKTELDWLENSKVIGRQESFYWFSKDFDQWQVSRVKSFQPEKLSELLSLNLNGNCPKLSELLSIETPELSKTLSSETENLVKHEEKTLQNTKFPTSNLALPKEILNKDIYIDLYIDKEGKTQEIWQKALEVIKEQVSKLNYQTWLAGTVGVNRLDGKFLIGVPSSFVADYLAKNQYTLIEKTLIGLDETGRPEFIVVKSEGGQET